MSEETLDPRHQQLMAALYGELSEEEEKAFHQSLLADPALRAEWEELRETRSLLGEWSLEEDIPSFVFMDQESESAPSRGRPGFLGGLWNRLPGPAWGFAGATAVMVVLLFSGFRVDRVNGGLAFRFGSNAVQTLDYAGAGRPGLLDVNSGDNPRATMANASSPGMTEESLSSSDIVRLVSALISDQDEKRKAELGFILNGMYEELRQERQEEMDDIKTRVEVVGLGLMAEQNRTNAQIRTLIDRGPLNGGDLSPLNQNEDN